MIGEFLKELDLTEGRSTGIPKILKVMKENGSPPPKFVTDEDRTSFLIRLPVQERATQGLAGEVTPQVTEEAGTKSGPSAESVARRWSGEDDHPGQTTQQQAALPPDRQGESSGGRFGGDRMSDVGRNEPCPCGSGKKYQKCCLGRQEEPAVAEGSAGVFAEIRQALEGRQLGSLEEANAFLADFSRQQNRRGREDFAGLSPEQMGRFLYHPFDSAELVTFQEVLVEEPTAPILTLFRLLVDAIGEQGLKPTAKGNLPRAFCREAALAYWGEDFYRERTRYGNMGAFPVFVT